jgi:excinuclease ABC subunit B
MAATAVADMKTKRDHNRSKSRIALISEPVLKYLSSEQRKDLIEQLRHEMIEAARDLEFERAAELRDEIESLSKMK